MSNRKAVLIRLIRVSIRIQGVESGKKGASKVSIASFLLRKNEGYFVYLPYFLLLE